MPNHRIARGSKAIPGNGSNTDMSVLTMSWAALLIIANTANISTSTSEKTSPSNIMYKEVHVLANMLPLPISRISVFNTVQGPGKSSGGYNSNRNTHSHIPNTTRIQKIRLTNGIFHGFFIFVFAPLLFNCLHIWPCNIRDIFRTFINKTLFKHKLSQTHSAVNCRVVQAAGPIKIILRIFFRDFFNF